MQSGVTKVFAGFLLAAGAVICGDAAEYPAAESFEKGCDTRWNKVDGTYWQLSKRSAVGQFSVSRTLFPTAKVSGRPSQLTAVQVFPVSEAFDMAIRSSLSCEDGVPAAARVDLIFMDGAGKMVKRVEYPLNSGIKGVFQRTVHRVEVPAGAVSCRPVLCAVQVGPLEQMVHVRFDDLQFGKNLPPEKARFVPENIIDLEAPKLDISFDRGANGWKAIDGKVWRLTAKGHTAPYAVRYTLPAAKEIPADAMLDSTVLQAVRGGEQYRLGARIRGGRKNQQVQLFVKAIYLDAAGKEVGEFMTRPELPMMGRFASIAGVTQVPEKAVNARLQLHVHFLEVPENGCVVDFDTVELTLWRDKAPAVPAYSFKMDSPDAGKWTAGNLSIGKFYNASRQPDKMYTDTFPNEWTMGSRLTDGYTGAKTDFCRNRYVGWRGEKPVSLTIDLGRPQKAEQVILSGYRDREAFFGTPKAWSAAISLDGKNYQEWGSTDVADVADGAYTSAVRGKAQLARYIRIDLTPRDAKNGLVLLDEITVNGQIKNTWKMVPAHGVYHGAFPPTYGFKEPLRNGRKAPMALDIYEKVVGKKVSMVLWYQGFDKERIFGELQDLLNIDLMADMRGPRFMSSGWLPPAKVSCQDIAEGRLDDYIVNYFRDAMDPAKTLNNRAPIWFRPLNEFNSGWVTWGFDPEGFRAAWWRLYNIAEQLGALDHHIFVWSPNHRSYPDVGWNKMERYYPGDQYVDWVGLSCYPPSAQYAKNEGHRYPLGRCEEVYAKYGSYKPMMVAEGGYDSPDRIDRVRWVREWFQIPEKYPNFKAMIWENHNTRVIQDGGEALELYRKLVQNPKWIGDLYEQEAGK